MPEEQVNVQDENARGGEEMHTPAEVELQRQLDIIRAQNEQLKETNAQLFRLAMGSQNEDKRTAIQKKLQRFFDSHFNVAELSKGE